jgi:crossover junction endodeoxyribonuclease RusA
MKTCFTIHGHPVPKGRPRLGRGHAYTPSTTRAWEEHVGWAYKEAGGPHYAGHVEVEMLFRVKGQAGDLDNLQKSLLDGLNGVAWDDDSQVRVLRATLVVGVPPEGVDVTIKEAA